MDRDRKRIVDPATHQPTKAEMKETIRIDATAEALARAVTHGGAKRTI